MNLLIGAILLASVVLLWIIGRHQTREFRALLREIEEADLDRQLAVRMENRVQRVCKAAGESESR